MMQVGNYEREAIRLLGSKLDSIFSPSPGTYLSTVNFPTSKNLPSWLDGIRAIRRFCGCTGDTRKQGALANRATDAGLN